MRDTEPGTHSGTGDGHVMHESTKRSARHVLHSRCCSEVDLACQCVVTNSVIAWHACHAAVYVPETSSPRGCIHQQAAKRAPRVSMLSRHRHLCLPHQLKDGERLVTVAAWHGDDGNACPACSRPVANRDVDEWDIVQARVKVWHRLRRDEEVPVHLS